ncbi:MAG: tRNA uridine-5-carboxymethylaminomethyl(34) synthesis GTPase MnmE [Clostridia bacterium]|nr:tRNA uridine-5-carboxymethylaminomethyl(34) synthesis GTPase MnmE [Clostridia bacterium]
MRNDTICAIATPIGTGGVGVIRISGNDSLIIASKLFRANSGKPANDFAPSKMYYGRLTAEGFADNCLCVYFKEPNSFTGEDVIEFHCHGGVVLLNSIIKAVIDSGARLAECGEFTKRAFISGKLDLAECEGLIDLINAQSEAALTAASDLADGKLSRRIQKLQEVLKELLSYAEVSIDYSEEDIDLADKKHFAEVLIGINESLKTLAKGYSSGKHIKEGVTVALCGKPNVGKSSLFNALLGYDRAIVTDIAGTTRDALEGSYIYKGVLFNIFDTAGIRNSSEIIEGKGIEISKKYIRQSDGAVFLAEDIKLSQEDTEILNLLKGKKHIKVLSKSDINNNKAAEGFDLSVSALSGKNIERLKSMLYQMLIGKAYAGGLILTNYRHYDAVKRAAAIIQNIIEKIDIMYMDMLAHNLREAWETLGEITGENSIESVIDNIFSRFCLGK